MIKKNLIYYLIALSFILLLLDSFKLLNSFKSQTDRIIISVKKPVYTGKLGFSTFREVLRQYPNLKTLLEMQANLKRVNEELILKTRVLTDENVTFRKQLEIPLPSSYKLIPAQILGTSRFLEVDAGEKEGIKPGMPAVLGNVYLGKVAAVTESRSSIMFLYDREMQIQVKTSRGTFGETSGQGEKSIALEKVLQKDPLFIDDQIVTTGLDGLPANLLIGKIVYINSDDSTPYKQAKIESFINLDSEKMIFIITAI
ncbi:hypothetical protein A2960_03065 [Candidatus Gottesmanbacteria bacterium RIFCSPLOWO2_01_FULL_39_12b]|uniref:Cell shape-determining protein MreC n=1 Tax=Candidatus Gottesmanbacteria bacterium RIFCSPLOWO2_01_FULL_39_12b TaxID=1798388 RepID=A0A1F6AQZ0_9BACT|nr:MAG: hypothetical protein A2960_03065 [Candidatus Gottesmanbacteria bacterium RIFCSPLOWO2_01_FULL_39_12b]